MFDQPKTYFILRPVVYRPDDLIRLGQVITDPRKPFQRLAEPLPLKGPLKPRVSPVQEWKVTRSQTEEHLVGLFANVVDIMKAEAEAGKSKNEVATWEAALLETKYFEISEDAEDPSYVDQTAKIPRVEKWLKDNRKLGKTVYMITGLKIAKNPSQITSDSADMSEIALDLQTTVDPQGMVQVGSKANKKKTSEINEQGMPQKAYVFAYRLRKLSVGWRKKLKVGKEVGGGELHDAMRGRADVTSGNIGDEEEDDGSFEIEKISLEDNDFGAFLPAKDKKLVTFDEDDNSLCLAIQTKDLGS